MYVVYSSAYQRKSGGWPMLIGKAKSFYDEMKIIDKYTFSEGSNKKTGNACRT